MAATGALSAAEKSHPMSEVRGRSREDPMPEGPWPRGVTPRPRSGASAGRSYPASEEWWLRGRRRAVRSYSTFKNRRAGCEEIPLFQGKEQRLRFAGAAVKRYPMSKVRETYLRCCCCERCCERYQRADTQTIITEN